MKDYLRNTLSPLLMLPNVFYPLMNVYFQTLLTLYFFFALLIQRFPSANASLPYFAVISAFLFLNHFPFLLKSIKIAVMNISLIFTNRNAITAITFFCYSVSVKLSLLSVYFSITAILFCRKFQTGHAINSPVS